MIQRREVILTEEYHRILRREQLETVQESGVKLNSLQGKKINYYRRSYIAQYITD